MWSLITPFLISFTGGSAAKFLCNGLPTLTTDWSKWRVFFCDERHVPFDDKECTYKIYKDNLMSKVPLAEDHIFPDKPDVSGGFTFVWPSTTTIATRHGTRGLYTTIEWTC